MEQPFSRNPSDVSRRAFLGTVGAGAAGVSLSASGLLGSAAFAATRTKQVPTVRGAFIYPPTAKLDKEGYYSWPGSTFDAEGRQKTYMAELKAIARRLNMRIVMDEKPLADEADIERFVNEMKASPPDGVLLVPFKKTDWQTHGIKMIDAIQLPTVVMATLGVLLIGSIRDLDDKPGVYLVSALDDFEAMERGLNMIRTARWMKDAVIINLQGENTAEKVVPGIGTTVRNVPRLRFAEVFQRIQPTQEVKALAKAYYENAQEVVEPSRDDVLDAAKTYFVLKQILEAEKGDAVMMECLPGLKLPHEHVPPCMGFMSLRDEGIAAGCESDLDATLTLMLLQQLFKKPGFQHNPFADTEKNHYLCAHCTSASKMHGLDAPAEPYVLRSHAEAGWGCVPRVLFSKGQQITIAKYLSGDAPQMLVYSGEILGCPPTPPAGGCRTNAETTLNEIEDVSDLKGHHLCMAYGDYADQLRRFCQLYGVEAVA